MTQNGNRNTREISLTRLAVQALALLIIVPALAVAYIFRNNVWQNLPALIFVFVIALMGFYLFFRVFLSINTLVKNLDKIARGEKTTLDLDDSPSHLKEMAEIIAELNKLTIEFRENAAQLERFIEQFTTLTELTEITARIPDIDELLSLVLRKAMSCTRARMGSVMLQREDGRGLDIVASGGWTPSTKGPINPDDTLAGKVIREGTPLLAGDISKLPEVGRDNNATRYSSPSFLIMPLVTKSATIGAVCLSEKPTGSLFTLQDQQFLTVMLGQVGFAVENARLLRQARESALELQKAIKYKDIQLQDAHRQIIQSEKLSALGQLIAGVAHEVNNPLTSVCGYAELLLMKTESEPTAGGILKEGLRTIHEEARRATKIVQNLLSFAREKKPETKPVDLNEIVEKIVELRQYDLKTHGIRIEMDLAHDLPKTMLDADQIQQVLLNLVNNSAQSLKEDGIREIRIGTRREGSEVHIWVSDTGSGIPSGLIDRIFDPFFTTKSGRTNSGLGLSISYGIVKEHGGSIEVDSVIDEGTTMTVRLPIVEMPEEESKNQASPDRKEDRCAGKKALVVDDEERVGKLAAEILRMSGFNVRMTLRAREALDVLLDDDYDLVLSDIRMPDLDGKDLYARVVETKPNMSARFIFASGDVADPVTRSFAESRAIKLISKPFSFQELTRAAREVVRNS